MHVDKEKEIKKLGLKQGAIKILINSIYGAFGNKWFYFYNVDIAQSITLQGQDMIKFSNRAIDFYFTEKWHLDTELHKLIGVDKYKINKVNDIAAIYTDTDSSYIQFGSAIDSIEHDFTDEEAVRLCILMDEHRFEGYFNDAFEKYGKLFNTENRQTFKLESISDKGFWIMKKNYAIRPVYEPNPKKEVFPLNDRPMMIKGLEPIKSSYPEWARTKLRGYTEYLLNFGDTLSLEDDLIPMIKKDRVEFEDLTPDDVAQNFSVRVYNKHVESEHRGLLLKGATAYSKAVMHHNHLILKNDLESTYPRIREGNKVRYYKCKPNASGVDAFAFNPGDYPTEVAPEMDKRAQFFILIVEPINRILGAIGVPKLDNTLKRAVEFKTSESKVPLTDAQLYPYHVINSETLEHCEVDKKFWKIIGNPDADVPDSLFDEYLETISRYGLNTIIIINKNLVPYKKRIAKKLGLDHILEEIEEAKQAEKNAKAAKKKAAKEAKEAAKQLKG
tara:strand:- start:6583 stop:8085 length:1503 start_codon:yes stop_codon:yes gene_type:complete